MNVVFCIVAFGVGFASAAISGPCGEAALPSARILGGVSTLECQWPFTALVHIRVYNLEVSPGIFQDVTMCGGGLISPDYVVTTGQCAVPVATEPSSVRVIVGSYDTEITNFGSNGAPEDVLEVSHVRIHPGFNNNTDNNIALLRLKTPVVYNNCKHPACLEDQLPLNPTFSATCDVPDVRTNMMMVSVGQRIETEGPSRIPQAAALELFSLALSRAIALQGGNSLPEGVILGRVMTGASACAFDWGGIIMGLDGLDWTLRGLIHSANCFIANDPSTVPTIDPPLMVTSIGYYRDWIDRCTDNIDACARYTLPSFII